MPQIIDVKCFLMSLDMTSDKNFKFQWESEHKSEESQRDRELVQIAIKSFNLLSEVGMLNLYKTVIEVMKGMRKEEKEEICKSEKNVKEEEKENATTGKNDNN